MQCGCGQRHWGRYGAAGLLLADGLADGRPHPDEAGTGGPGASEPGASEPGASEPGASEPGASEPDAGEPDAGGAAAGGSVVLQHRAPWSHHGDTWGIPGGARNSDETAVQAAIREAGEEAGVNAPVRPHATHELAHPDWSYTTVLARGPAGLQVQATDAESIEVRWHPIERVTELPLLAAFEAAWPVLRQMLHTRAVLVVDSANVVGSRPDGWWHDRAGATSRLGRRLSALAARGVPAGLLDLPGHTWWPAVVLVTEGQARAADDAEGIETLRAEGDGDDAIAAVVTDAMGVAAPLSGRPASGTPASAPAQRATQNTAQRATQGATQATAPVQVTVVTADRGLRRRVESAGARVVGPGSLWRVLDEIPH